MSKSEEILYQARALGIMDKVLEISERIKGEDKWMDIGDRLELAYNLARELVTDNAEAAELNDEAIKTRTLNQLRQVKTYGYRAPDDGEEFAPDAPGEEGEEVRVLLNKMDIKLDVIEAKLDFILKHLEIGDV